MSAIQASSRLAQRTIRRIGAALVVALWASEFIEASAVAYVDNPKTVGVYYFPRALLVSVGILTSLLTLEVSVRVTDQPLRKRFPLLVLAVAISLLAVCYADYFLFYARIPANLAAFNASEFLYMCFAWSWFILSVAGAIVALCYLVETRDRDGRLAELRSIADAAQIRALRYQLNPHFLFNTLNSITALVSRGRKEPAIRMMENLADFLRATLYLDPHQDVTLDEEIGLQRLYLEIETLRFPKRLGFEVDVPEEARRVRLPSLITQPIIENVIKHAVARSRKAVKLKVSAALDGEDVRLSIENTGGDSRTKTEERSNVGLANVAARLAARFGARHRFSAGPTEGGYAVQMVFPLSMPQALSEGLAE